MKKRLKIVLPILFSFGIVVVFGIFLRGRDIAVIHPAGTVAERQKDLLIFATLLGMVVIIPVFAMTIFFAWRYREGNKKANYQPEWSSNNLLEFIWWGIPIIIILILSVVTWQSSYELDPYRPLESETKPVTIQVVALQWKWLFIYPEQDIATVNLVQFPEDTPVNFEITSDAPMNSFWIPKLGGQVYAMNGMVTKLHLQADEVGEYEGVSANISGEGFAGMKFVAKASSQTEFEEWAKAAKHSGNKLTLDEYDKLTKPSKSNPVALYSLAVDNLRDSILDKYMRHNSDKESRSQNMEQINKHEIHH